ncbi:CusA/CzcA family heavy metal efflux RND transporter [Pseudoalteromonas sp. B28]|uniref:efflux RND transporter permease subunit n=1 Tax=Pseudoalteromonas TaxID=53246 RepID=UPI0015F98627|nr:MULTISPECIES: CusA/CzcA family heavy metal efflux RND transporter [Pseudoalteromonas]MBB1276938.1 CusA/CzcA family heavy metal efflux RND transporter [Pseudoalteromonas sp. SR43-3]MBB1328714.1 CusA/CzcA family heavy metal efflux RND transporter [Pseudoalteromonas sp. SR43-7]MBB1334673.1 CusA/CzcA family heavy metal efflux RND transporter [Pseudoalteromonas sp. SR41-6]MBB1378077.1 CusA/CzcA family heavy metal efflux RND transporter [Pseudoalteromonas sp. SR43-2]MBB1460182.1 CusA/CzcA family 
MIESILRLSIERRGIMLMLIFLVLGMGIFSYQKLPIDAVPDITNVQVQINTQAPGYSPLETEQRITFVVETALAGLPDLSYTRSLSRYGLSQVTAVFDEGTDLYFARNLINTRLGAIKSQLPEGLAPEMGPIATGLGEIYMYTLRAKQNAMQKNGEPYNAMALREIHDWIVKPQLALVKGITEVNAIGGYVKQYHVNPEPQLMLNFDISLSDIHRALERNNTNQGAGFVERNGQQILVRSQGQLQTLSDIENVVIKRINTVPVAVKDIGSVAIGKELRTGAATQEGEETVLGTAMMLVGENSRAVAQSVAKKVKDIQSSLPDGIVIEPVYDRTLLVDKAIETVQKNLVEGALLVIVILFILLGNIRAALITAAVIPLAMLATITGMVNTGVSANLMSLGALDFGLIVDGAVIIVENCIRRLSESQKRTGGVLPLKGRLELVFQATNEVIRPSLFGVLIITVVYIPLFSLTGVEGKMFQPMAATVIMALIAAMLFSITIVPAAVAMFMAGKVSEKESFIIVAAKSAYRPIINLALKLRWIVLFGSVVLVVGSLWLATRLGSEFVPQLDEGDIALHAMRIPGTGIEQAVAMQKTLESTLMEYEQVLTVFAKTGTAEVATDAMPPNVTDTFVMLKPRAQWPDPDLSKAEFVETLERDLQAVTGNNYEFTQPIQMRFNELISGVRADLGIKVFGDDLTTLVASANDILTVLQSIDGVADARLEQVDDIPIFTINPKPVELARYGLDVADLQEWLASAIGGNTAGLIFEGDRRFELLVRFDEGIRTNLDAIDSTPIITSDGEFVPLSEVATLGYSSVPNQISRENGKRRVVVTANVRERDLGSFVDEAKIKITEQVALPAGYWLDYGGTFEQLESASQRLSIVVPATLFLILVLLVVVFGSFRDALIIFTGVPLALTGGVFALWMRDMPLSISAGVGFIALSGIAVLNGLVMLSFIKQRVLETGDLINSIVDGAITRLRPVLMTALVASLGFIPMALNVGTGAEVQRPLATVVIGGIISSTILTLVVLPILYRMMHSKLTKE